MMWEGVKVGRRAILGLAAGSLLLLGVVFGPVPRGDAALYWGNSYLGRANLNGSLPYWPLPNGFFPTLEPGAVCGLAIDSEHLYWADSSGGTIGRATLDGYSPDDAFISGTSTPCGVAVNGSHIYWAEFDANMLGRAEIDGTDVEVGFISGAAGACGVAVHGPYVYWSNQDAGSIGRSNLDGTGVNQGFVTGLGSPCGVGVNAEGIYWGDQGLNSVGRANLDGGEVERLLVSDAGEPWAVAVNSSHVYWADRRGRALNPSGGIGRATLRGGEVNHDVIPGIDQTTGVALDDRVFTTTPAAPGLSGPLHYGKLTHNLRSGTVQLIVYAPADGAFQVDSPGVSWRLDKGNPPQRVRNTFRWRLTLWPGKGPVGKRIRRQLQRTGRAPIKLRMTYQEEGRLPREGVKRLAFRRLAPRAVRSR